MLKIHFLNVGHGDCIFIEFTETNRTALIDINRTSEMDEESNNELIEEALQVVPPSYKEFYKYGAYNTQQLFEKAGFQITLQDPITYLQEKNITKVFRFISSHPHMDHLSGLKELFDNIGFYNIWLLKNDFSPDFKKLTDSEKKDWALYKQFRDSLETKYDGTTIVRPTEGDERDFWKQDGISILSPSDELLKNSKDNDNPNEMSYVIMITYGVNKIILGGDAEQDTWEHLKENHKDKLENVTILKASHHGRKSGFHEEAVKLMKPAYTIVSVGKKPKTDASNLYKKYCDNVWSTRWKGNIRFELNKDGTGTYYTEYDR